MENSKPNFYAVIPADVRYCEKITPNAKLLYGEITALCSKEGYCWASNQYFSELYGAHKDTVSNWVSSLRENGFIRIEIVDLTSRKIYVVDRQNCLGGSAKTPRGDRQKHRHSNTVITTSKNKKATAFSPYGKKGSMEAVILSEEQKRMMADEQKGKRAHAIIGAFISYKMDTLKNNIRTKGQLYEFWQRHIKTANKLKVWDDDQLERAFEKADKEYQKIEWSLEALLKYLTK